MEIIIIFAAVGLLIWLIFFLHDRSDQNPPNHQSRSILSQSKPFNAQKSKPRYSNIVLKGRAFVVDGDTIKIRHQQIRLYGIDAPEMNHPYGINAKRTLMDLCKGKEVQAALMAEDDFGRFVARCTLSDGTDLSAKMVALGMAIDWPKYSGGEYTNLEVPGVRKKLWLADARQKGRMDVWQRYEASKQQNT